MGHQLEINLPCSPKPIEIVNKIQQLIQTQQPGLARQSARAPKPESVS